jgi:hypothetical protein
VRTLVVALEVVIPDVCSLRQGEARRFVDRPLAVLAAWDEIPECGSVIEDANLHLKRDATRCVFEGYECALALIDGLGVDSASGISLVERVGLSLLERHGLTKILTVDDDTEERRLYDVALVERHFVRQLPLTPREPEEHLAVGPGDGHLLSRGLR